MNDSVTRTSREEQVAQAVDEFTAARAAGEVPDVGELAARYPAVADDLRRLLPALADLDPSPVSDSAGTDFGSGTISGVLGDFRIIREVGRGGMGVVYEAKQISLPRRVALKVLPFAATMDTKHLQRFQNEARAAASLNHPNIGPVFGVGCERGIYFYAMQFIDGVTLARVIGDMHPPADASTPTAEYVSGGGSTLVVAGLSTEHPLGGAEFCRTAAKLIIQAAEALEHAHSLGIVHRDVKPGNLMVDATGKLWVADFGLAKIGAEGGPTMSGDRIGTLRYMSPEQAMARHGLVDHRTDVYALGATLYELLTGRPAVTGDDEQEVLRRIAFEEPAAPRKLNRAILRDLETIVLKAIEKNPADRYASAKELADDLRSYLTEEAIRAKRPSLARRTAKWARRHRAIVTTSAAALAVLLVGLGVAVGKVSVAKRNAEEREAETKAVLNFVEERIFAAARPQNVGGGLGREITLRQAIESALPHVEQDFQDQPLIEARLRMTLGLSFHHLGDDEVALQQFERANTLYFAHRGPDHPDTILCKAKMANAIGPGKESLRLRTEVYEQRKSTLGDDDLNTLAAAINLGNGYDEAGKYDEALKLREDALARMARVAGEDHADTDICRNNLAISYARLGRHGEALRIRVDLFKRQLARPLAETEALLAAMNNLAESYQADGHWAEARRLFEETLRLTDEKLGPKYDKTLLVMNNLAWLLATAEDAKLRNPARAVELAEEVINRSKAPNAARFGTRGTARYRAGEWKPAAADLEKAIGMRNPADSMNANEAFFLAMACWKLGDQTGARDWFKKANDWMTEGKTRDDEVHRFRAEAAELLGTK